MPSITKRRSINFHFMSLLFYFVGLVFFLFALLEFLPFFAFLSGTPAMILNLAALILSGYDVVSAGIIGTVKSSWQHKRFKPNIHILMALGAIGAVIIGDYRDAALLILIFAGAHFLEEYAEAKSKKEITNLLKITPKNARLLNQDGTTSIVDVSQLKIDDQVLVLNGDQVPTDGLIIQGIASINESMITGESIPAEKVEGSDVFGGSINGNSTFVMRVSKNSDETVLAKILQVVSQTQTNFTKTATFIKKFEPIYVTVVMLVAPLFYLFGFYVLGWTAIIADNGLNLAFNRMIILFIGASPCALAVSDIPATLSALSLLAKRGVLFKGGAPLSLFADVKAVAFDKTGTLTYGKPQVTDVLFIQSETPETQNELITIIVSMEKKTNHPLAHALVNHFAEVKVYEMEVETIPGKGIRSIYQANEYKIGKPSLYPLSPDLQTQVDQLSLEGKTVIMLIKNDQPVVMVALLDVAKDSAKHGLTYFNERGIATVMITGDNALTAQAIGDQLGISKIYANVLPEEKQNIVKELKATYGLVAMIGDGINDAPALVEATLGIAMGDGTDVAIDVADGVLVNNDFLKLTLTHAVSRKLKQIVVQNIVFAMSVVAFLIGMNFFFTLPMGVAVAVHEGSTVLVILNGLRLLNFRNPSK